MEKGGIIIGRTNLETSNLVIEYITEPMKNDVSLRNNFIRQDEGHLDFFNSLYIESRKSYAYVGEWHTHPQDIPTFSYDDLKNWEKIGEYMQPTENTQYHIIVGRKALGIWNYNYKLRDVVSLGIYTWKEIE